MSSLTSPYCPYTNYKGKGGKYPKKVSKGDLPVEVWLVMSVKRKEEINLHGKTLEWRNIYEIQNSPNYSS
jgi:hypothetical protein